jgi:arsenate reductase
VFVSDKPSVVFVCVHNAGRSQMAAGFLRHLAGDAVTVASAGSEPANALNPTVVAAMAERGIELAGIAPRLLTTETLERAGMVVTMGCGDACPVVPGRRHEDWSVDDPQGKSLAEVRLIRDDIQARVWALVRELGLPEP